MSAINNRSGFSFYKLVVVLTALALLVLMAPRTSAQTPTADATPIALPGQLGPVPGDTVLLQTENHGTRVEATVTELADPYPSVSTTRRGYRVLGVHVTFANSGPDSFTVDPSAIVMVDDAGLYVFEMRSLHYLKESGTALLERSTLKPGDSTSGWLVYELLSDAKPGELMYLISSASDPRLWMMARFGGTDAAPADPTVIMSRSATAIGTIQIEQIVSPFERTDPSIAPLRGSRAVSVGISVENAGDSTMDLDDSFYLVDQFGAIYNRYYYDRSATSRAAYPELKIRVRPGQTQRGVITFELPLDSSIAMILLLPNQEQIFTIGGGYDAITVTPDEYAGSEEDEEWGTEIPGCEGVKEWAEGSTATMKMANEVVEGIKDTIDTATPSSIRNAAASLRHTAQVQEAIVAPTNAHQAQLDLTALLRTAADMLDDMADRIESGEPPETVAEMMDAPGSPYMLAGKAAIFSALNVIINCPIE